MDEIYIKYFISFVVGVLVYCLIISMNVCNIVEGQNNSNSNNNSNNSNSVIQENKYINITKMGRMDGNEGSVTQPACLNPTKEKACVDDKDEQKKLNASESLCKDKNCEYFERYEAIYGGQISNLPQSMSQLSTTLETVNNVLNNASMDSSMDGIVKAVKTINDNIPEAPKSFDYITNFYQLGETPDALDYVELLVRTVVNADPDKFKVAINTLLSTADYCKEDLNAYIMSFMLLKYNSINSQNKQNYIIISNRLSKYIPDILEKIQNLNESCSDDINAKSQILDAMIYKLFKNNETTINFNGFGRLMKSLENVKTIYIALFMICITYIIVKFLGMFNMKVNM